MFALALAPSCRKASATDAASGPDPQPVIDEIAAIDAALDSIAAMPMGTDAEQQAATDAAANLTTRIEALPVDSLDDIADPAWHDAADAMRDLHNRLADLAGQPRDDAEEEPATKRRRLLDDIIVDGFYGGMYLAGKAAWFTLKTAVSGAVAAGKLAAPHIARGVNATAQALAEGAVEVEAYIRNGKPVHAYTRKPPGAD